MAHEILSVKMYELDKKLEQTHSRIQLAESMDAERLHQQIQNLRQECQESRITLENRLRHSKTDCVMKLAGVYDQVEAAVGKVLEAALSEEEISGVIINLWNRTLMLDKTLIRIVLGDVTQ